MSQDDHRICRNVTPTKLASLTRKVDRGGNRRLVEEVFDHPLVATVIDDERWSVPMLVVRDEARLLLHGSTAGLLREVAAALDRFTDATLPGRSRECPPHNRRECPATSSAAPPTREK